MVISLLAFPGPGRAADAEDLAAPAPAATTTLAGPGAPAAGAGAVTPGARHVDPRLHRALEEARAAGDPTGLARASRELGLALQAAGDQERAAEVFRKALALAGESAVGLAGSGRFEEAYALALEERAVGDLLLNQEQMRELNRLELEHTRLEAERRREIEREDFDRQQRVRQELHEAEQRRQYLTRTIVLGGAIAALLLGVVLHRAWRETRLALAKMRRSDDAARRANKSKDRFFSVVAHDLRSPFAAIIGLSQFVLEDFGKMGDEEKVRLLKEVNDTGKRTHLLLENLLRWAYLQTGNRRLSPVPVDLAGTVEAELGLLRVNAGQKGITVHNEVPAGTFVFADSDAIATVVRNLISNAIKFTGEGGAVTVGARRSGRGKKEVVEAWVADDGVGIPPDRMGGLFDLGESVSTTGTAGEKGTGLGLTLCHEFIHQSGGEIRAESSPGDGTRIVFSLPSANREPPAPTPGFIGAAAVSAAEAGGQHG